MATTIDLSSFEQEIGSAIRRDAQIEDIIELCEEYEIEASQGEKSAQQVACHLLAYLNDIDLESARFLWKRQPENFQKNPQIQAIWVVARNIIEKKYDEFYASLNGFSWDPLVVRLIERLRSTLQNHCTHLVATAYSCISPSSFGVMLGKSTEETVAYAQALGWSIEEGLIKPIRPNIELHHSTGLGQLNQLTSYVLHMERQPAKPT